jgi:hypothetical protein
MGWMGIIYGLPGEGYTDFRNTLSFALSLRSNNYLGLYRYCYYPGTYLYEHEKGYITVSDNDPEIISGPSITTEEVKSCNTLAAFYWIIHDCFPFTLMAMPYFYGFNRVNVIETFAEKMLSSLPAKFRDVAANVSFANKNEEAKADLAPIMQRIINEPRLYGRLLAESISEQIELSEKGVDTLSRWLALDVRYKPFSYLIKLRLMIGNEGRLKSFMAGVFQRTDDEASRPRLFKLGGFFARSRTANLFATLLISILVPAFLVDFAKKTRNWLISTGKVSQTLSGLKRKG